MYDYQKVEARADGEQDYIFLVFKVDPDVEAKLEPGESYDHTKRVQFRIKWCGDENNCFTTRDYDAKSSTLEKDMKACVFKISILFRIFGIFLSLKTIFEFLNSH